MGNKPPKQRPQPIPEPPPAPPPPPAPVSYRREGETTATRKGSGKNSLGQQFLQRRKATPAGSGAFGKKQTLG